MSLGIFLKETDATLQKFDFFGGKHNQAFSLQILLNPFTVHPELSHPARMWPSPCIPSYLVLRYKSRL